MAGIQSKFDLIKRYGIEYIFTGLLGGIPSPVGRLLRNISYRTFFGYLGRWVNIQANVRFIGTDAIAIGDRVQIYSGTCISKSVKPKYSIRSLKFKRCWYAQRLNAEI